MLPERSTINRRSTFALHSKAREKQQNYVSPIEVYRFIERRVSGEVFYCETVVVILAL